MDKARDAAQWSGKVLMLCMLKCIAKHHGIQRVRSFAYAQDDKARGG